MLCCYFPQGGADPACITDDRCGAEKLPARGFNCDHCIKHIIWRVVLQGYVLAVSTNIQAYSGVGESSEDFISVFLCITMSVFWVTRTI